MIHTPQRPATRRQSCLFAQAIVKTVVVGLMGCVASVTAFAVTLAYVPNYSNNTVSVIDTSTRMQTALLAGFSGPYSAVLAPNGSVVYVANFNANSVSPVNPVTQAIGPTISVGTSPVNVTFSADSAKAYVSNYSANSISVIDVASATVTSTVSNVCSSGQPVNTVFHGSDLLIACQGGSIVRRMETANSNALSTLATVGSSVYNLAISGSSGFGYAANYSGAGVTKFDLTTGVATTYPTPGVTGALSVGVAPDGSQIFIGDYSGSNLLVMSPNGTVLATLSLGASVAGIGVSRSGDLVYVPLRGSLGIKVIDTASLTVVATIANPGANVNLVFGDFLGSASGAPAPAPTPAQPDAFPKLGAAPYIPGLVGQPRALDLSQSDGRAIPGCLLPTLKRVLGGEPVYQGQSASGATQIAWNGQLISLYPLAASTSHSQSEGVHFQASNALDIVTPCGTLSTAPAVNNLNELGAQLSALGLSAQFNEQGVATVIFNGSTYVLRPDYMVTLGAPTTASLAFGVDGVLRLSDSEGRTQALHPAFLDVAGLSAHLSSTQGGWLVIQDDGNAVFTRFNGQQTVLVPDLTLSPAPADKAGQYSWQDAPNHFMFRSQLFMQPQGYSVKPR